MMRKSFVFLLFLSTVGFASSPMTPQQLVDRVDELYRSESSYSKLRMLIQTPNWKRELRLEAWSRGTGYTLIRIHEPKKDHGIATLRRDREMWNYFPKINKVVKVPPSMMMGSWMGSDFTNDDLVKQTRMSEEYDIVLTEDAKVYSLTLTPKAVAVTVWGKIELRVEKDSLLPLEEVFYDERGKKMRIMSFLDRKTFATRTLPAKLELVPVSKTGHKTVVVYDDVIFNAGVKDDIFTLQELQKRF